MTAAFSRPFAGRAAFHADEPAYGLLLRTAEHNGMRGTNKVFRLAGVVGGQGVHDVDPDEVARLCRHDDRTAAVRHASPVLTTLTVDLLGSTLSRDHFSVVRRRWCPLCMREDPYHRAWWDLHHFTACPDHGLAMADDCVCRPGHDPQWRTSHVGACRCGRRLEDAVVAPATAPEIDLSRYLRDRLLGLPRSATVMDDLPTLGDALAAMEAIGAASMRDTLPKLRRSIGRGEVAAEGFRVACGGEAAVLDLLDRIATRPEKKARWGVEHAYGTFYGFVDGLEDGSALAALLKPALLEHASRTVRLKTGSMLVGVEVPRQPGIDLTEAAARCGMTFERFRRIGTLAGLLPRSSIQGTPARLDEGKVEELATRLAGSVSREEAAGLLDIAPHAAGRLIKADPPHLRLCRHAGPREPPQHLDPACGRGAQARRRLAGPRRRRALQERSLAHQSGG